MHKFKFKFKKFKNLNLNLNLKINEHMYERFIKSLLTLQLLRPLRFVEFVVLREV